MAAVGVGWWVTSRPEAAPAASLLPIVWTRDTVIAHFAQANSHWRELGDDSPALVIVTGPDGYVSPNWYPSKVEHGRVVPTWNYSAVHLTGRVRVHHDPEWLRAAVTALTDRHESSRDEPWQVSDAPASYVEGQLRGIDGVELTVTGVEGKAKLSQNRSAADREGVITGLRADGQTGGDGVADAMGASLRGE